MDDVYLDNHEAAAYAGVTVATLLVWKVTGLIESTSQDGKSRYTQRQLDRFLLRGRNEYTELLYTRNEDAQRAFQYIREEGMVRYDNDRTVWHLPNGVRLLMDDHPYHYLVASGRIYCELYPDRDQTDKIVCETPEQLYAWIVEHHF